MLELLHAVRIMCHLHKVRADDLRAGVRRPIQHGNFVQHVYRFVRHKHSGERQRVKQALGNGLKVRPLRPHNPKKTLK